MLVDFINIYQLYHVIRMIPLLYDMYEGASLGLRS